MHRRHGGVVGEELGRNDDEGAIDGTVMFVGATLEAVDGTCDCKGSRDGT